MFDFRRITLFCLEKRLSKHKMTIFSKNFRGAWPLCPPLAMPTHLKELAENFDRYFPPHEDPRKGSLWISNPFAEDNHSCNLNSCVKECLAELCCDTTLLSKYKMQSLAQFWISLESEYASLSEKAFKLLMIFSTAYLCEKSFSALSVIKTKQRNRMDVSAVLRFSEKEEGFKSCCVIFVNICCKDVMLCSS